MEAAAHYQLGDSDAGVGFEPAGFQELIPFIENLPF